MQSIIIMSLSFVLMSFSFASFAQAQNLPLNSTHQIKLSPDGFPTVVKTKSGTSQRPSAPQFDDASLPDYSRNNSSSWGPNCIHIPLGTEVNFRTEEWIDPANVNTGDNVGLLVELDVVVEGVVVIPMNAKGYGFIRVRPATASTPGGVYIEVQRVQDANGGMVQLNGQVNLTTGFPGQSTGVEPGKSVHAYVKNKTKFRLQ